MPDRAIDQWPGNRLDDWPRTRRLRGAGGPASIFIHTCIYVYADRFNIKRLKEFSFAGLHPPSESPAFTAVKRRARSAAGAGKGEETPAHIWEECRVWSQKWPGGQEAVREPPKAKEDEGDPLVAMLTWAGRE
ncbi:hypothetical protein BDZ91DRAFT_799646 [Kalaharituber pfeilii]|nr:hypothetical protein BDZ91DRAFT_799646 [Kalaharituber pfeilii]